MRFQDVTEDKLIPVLGTRLDGDTIHVSLALPLRNFQEVTYKTTKGEDRVQLRLNGFGFETAEIIHPFIGRPATIRAHGSAYVTTKPQTKAELDKAAREQAQVEAFVDAGYTQAEALEAVKALAEKKAKAAAEAIGQDDEQS